MLYVRGIEDEEEDGEMKDWKRCMPLIEHIKHIVVITIGFSIVSQTNFFMVCQLFREVLKIMYHCFT